MTPKPRGKPHCRRRPRAYHPCPDFAISSGSDERASAVRVMLASAMSTSQVARVTGIGRATLYRHLGALQET